MLSLPHRLKKSEDFKGVLRVGRSAQGEFLILKYKKTKLDRVRVGFIVGKKVAENATVRNKVRRRLRAAIEVYIKDIKPGLDILIIPRQEVISKKFNEVKRELWQLLSSL